MSMCKYN